MKDHHHRRHRHQLKYIEGSSHMQIRFQLTITPRLAVNTQRTRSEWN